MRILRLNTLQSTENRPEQRIRFYNVPRHKIAPERIHDEHLFPVHHRLAHPPAPAVAADLIGNHFPVGSSHTDRYAPSLVEAAT